MTWNISNVQPFNYNQIEPTLKISGFNPNRQYSCFSSNIIKTTLNNAMSPNNIMYYHEGHYLSIVTPDEVYIVTIDIFEDPNMYDDMVDDPHVSIDQNQYFNTEIYMGLPLLVFGQWKGVMKI